MKKAVTATILRILFLISVTYIFLCPFQITYHCRRALEMCLNTVIPSLFVFTVFSHILSSACGKSQVTQPVISFISHRIFSMESSLFIQCIYGLFAGAAPAAVGLETLYSKGGISKKSCENAVMLFSGCSAPFIITVAASSLDSTPLAVMLLIANLLAVLTSFFILCNKEKNFTIQEKSQKDYSLKNDGGIFAGCVTSAMRSIINMCSYIMFFMVASGVICDRISVFINNSPALLSLINGLFEMTGGITSACAVSGNEKIMIISAVCGFSGLSIIFQMASVCSRCKISIKKFIFSRLLCTLLCPLYMLLLMFLLPNSISCFISVGKSVNHIANPDNTTLFCRSFLMGIVALTALILVCIDKKHKKNV